MRGYRDCWAGSRRPSDVLRRGAVGSRESGGARRTRRCRPARCGVPPARARRSCPRDRRSRPPRAPAGRRARRRPRAGRRAACALPRAGSRPRRLLGGSPPCRPLPQRASVPPQTPQGTPWRMMLFASALLMTARQRSHRTNTGDCPVIRTPLFAMGPRLEADAPAAFPVTIPNRRCPSAVRPSDGVCTRNRTMQGRRALRVRQLPLGGAQHRRRGPCVRARSRAPSP